MTKFDQDEQTLTPSEVAEYFRVPLATVYKWRTQGSGPKAARVGRHLRYRVRDIREYLDQQTKGGVR